MIKPVVIFGISELAQLAHYYFLQDSPRQVAGFTVDQGYAKSTEFCGLPLVPFDRLQDTFPPVEFDLFVAIGYTNLNAARTQKYSDAKARGYCLASYVSTRASTWPDLVVGENCFIMEGNLIQPFVKVGNNVIMCCGNLISHHVEIGDNCFIASEVTVSGGVKIEPNCFIGVNATIREHVTIGRNCIIGAGALILKDALAEHGYLATETKSAGIPEPPAPVTFVTALMAKRVAILQSNYLPWKGYFDLIHDVDLFVFYDDVQYTKNDWRNRNKIKTPNGAMWLTVPTGTDLDRLVCEVRLTDTRWAEKHWKSLQQFYSRTPHFKRYEAFFKDVYLGRRWENLSELNQYLIKAIASDRLGIRTQFADSRDYSTQGKNLERLMELIAKVGAEIYVSGPAAKRYIEADRFTQLGVDLVYKSYDGYPEYPQSYTPFEHSVSIVDLLFNVGPEAPRYIWGWREASMRE